MKTLIAKEVRLLLPTFVGALALAVLPIWLWPTGTWDRNPGMYPSFLSFGGILLLALASFGREVGLRTFSFLMAQPVSRLRLWRVKIGVLAVCLGIVFSSWWLSAHLRAVVTPHFSMPWEETAIAGIFSIVLATGGLCFTIWLRQTVAAFWLALLLPNVLATFVAWLGANEWVMAAFSAVYSGTAFYLARREFFRAQDTAWTGGTISFSRGNTESSIETNRNKLPWRALVAKEWQLQQVTLLGMTGLFLIHLFVVMMRKLGPHVLGGMVYSALEMFGAVWLFVPFLAGGQSVGDERQMGTMDSLLCLPFSRRRQFSIKIVSVLLIGGILSGLLLFSAEKFGLMIGARANVGSMGIHFTIEGLVEILIRFIVLAWIAIYASTLARGILPGMAIGIIATLAIWQIGNLSFYPPLLHFGSRLWPRFLSLPLLFASVILAFRNYRFLFEAGRCWRKNALVLSIVLFVGMVCAAGTYQRAWEIVLPLESTHGAAVIKPEKPLFLGVNEPGGAIVLPDGRLWLGSFVYNFFGPKLQHEKLISGTNWANAFYEQSVIAMQKNGTLWKSKKPTDPWGRWNPESIPLVQFANGTNWQTVLCHNMVGQAALLKKDGTLWTLPNLNSKWTRAQGLRGIEPQQVGSESNWDRIETGPFRIYAWKQDGTAWMVNFSENRKTREDMAFEINVTPVAFLDNIRFKCVNQSSLMLGDIAVRDDGTLWHWMPQTAPRYASAKTNPGIQLIIRDYKPGLVQVGKDSDWTLVSGAPDRLAGLKADGSLWLWSWNDTKHSMNDAFVKPPVRLGTHNDWIGLGCYNWETVALSADGTLWCWRNRSLPDTRWNDQSPLRPSRRPIELGNIFSR